MQRLQAIPKADEPPHATKSSVPLVVDLDGTLIHSNLLVESVIALVKRSFLSILLLPLWLMGGKAAFKAQVTKRVALDLSALPFNRPLVEHLKREKARGRRLVLATGAHESLAHEIAHQLGLFEEVFASDGKRNLTSHDKLAALRDRFGTDGFDYAGNAAADFPIWRAARFATVVNASPRTVNWAFAHAHVDEVFPRRKPTLAVYVQALRLHQWLKNLLLFTPLIAALRFTDTEALVALLTGFFAFSLCASSVYLLNDIVDIEDDRRHPEKRRRPFASGRLPIAHGFVLIPALLAGSAVLSSFLPWKFGAVLAVYYAVTLAYTFFLKRLEAVDVVTLALLYTTRIFAGGAAASIPLSQWLLTFSIFIFLSLAFAKRCAELLLMQEHGKKASLGRGYLLADLQMLNSMGVGAGYVAALVLALYLSTPQVLIAYARPGLLWVFVPLLIFWVTRIWLKTCRGEMRSDPLVFAARDRVSLAFAVLGGGVIWLAM
ncbi:UbiA family prenyltransferase [Mesorhizobium sp. M1B.F.Ca.ET.045.04.1.1]|uniref:UbiA family prenyltransferase n=1 Tax=Mesorhizobium sp. M1B.F.Ca.ET.045.04.1.1 TaxID=2493673 RepID=UPI000F75F0C9|nr:UbiA family prenyltransferase [Mesorhizobium sp. M1B.F.Ca.ET.045.04.1.1]AZO31434.1 UbiA family prenyltransferase [Mesorhizobium sp. M1B.F.Ca.ET.045.04.1.1]